MKKQEIYRLLKQINNFFYLFIFIFYAGRQAGRLHLVLLFFKIEIHYRHVGADRQNLKEFCD